MPDTPYGVTGCLCRLTASPRGETDVADNPHCPYHGILPRDRTDTGVYRVMVRPTERGVDYDTDPTPAPCEPGCTKHSHYWPTDVDNPDSIDDTHPYCDPDRGEHVDHTLDGLFTSVTRCTDPGDTPPAPDIDPVTYAATRQNGNGSALTPDELADVFTPGDGCKYGGRLCSDCADDEVCLDREYDDTDCRCPAGDAATCIHGCPPAATCGHPTGTVTGADPCRPPCPRHCHPLAPEAVDRIWNEPFFTGSATSRRPPWYRRWLNALKEAWHD